MGPVVRRVPTTLVVVGVLLSAVATAITWIQSVRGHYLSRTATLYDAGVVMGAVLLAVAWGLLLPVLAATPGHGRRVRAALRVFAASAATLALARLVALGDGFGTPYRWSFGVYTAGMGLAALGLWLSAGMVGRQQVGPAEATTVDDDGAAGPDPSPAVAGQSS